MKKLSVIMTVVFGMFFGMMPQASASESEVVSFSDLQLIRAAAERPLNQTEADYLIESYPEIAAALPDLNDEVAVDVSRDLALLPSSIQAGQGCKTSTATHSVKSIAGLSTVFTLQASVYWCWDSGSVVQVNQPSSRILYVHALSRSNGVIDSHSSKSGQTGTATVMWHFTTVVPKVGELLQYYPRITINLYGNGTDTHGITGA